MNRTILLRSMLAGGALALAPLALAQEATGVLNRAASAMGSANVRTLEFKGAGTGGGFGQAYIAGMAWPRANIASLTRQVDYENVFTHEFATRSRAEPRGGTALPLAGQALGGGAASQTLSWNTAGPNATPRQAAHAQRLHDLWITPHGVIKAAQRHPTRLDFRTIGGKSLPAVSFTVPGVMRATAIFNEDFTVERVESWMPDPVMGDTAVVTVYSEYRNYPGGVKFPARIDQTAGGHMVLQLIVTDVTPNANVDIKVPANVAAWKETVAVEKAADGVWFFAGGSHNSAAIEMADHVILVEAPLDDGRTNAVIAELRKLSNKPIRYVVNSHNHFDHSGGLRAAAAAGATVVTQAQSKPWFDKTFANPNRIAPDSLAKSGRRVNVVGVGDKMVMKSGARVVELHKIKNSVHGDAMLMVYLPNEKILIEADVYTPIPPGAKPPSAENARNIVGLADNLEQAKLVVDKILPLHGRIVDRAEMMKTIGR